MKKKKTLRYLAKKMTARPYIGSKALKNHGKSFCILIAAPNITPGSYVRNSLISQSCGVIIKAMLSCKLGLWFKKASHSRKLRQHS